MVYRKIKKLLPYGNLISTLIILTQSLENDYPEATGCSTYAVYRDSYRDVKQGHAKPIIQMTFHEKRPTETLLNGIHQQQILE